MTKLICDRCGAEINPVSELRVIWIGSKIEESSIFTKTVHLGKTIEICPSCAISFEKWTGRWIENENDL